ncbi:retrotransposon protein, putative, ty3-gypsy subclass [Tanacetum coccineum]
MITAALANPLPNLTAALRTQITNDIRTGSDQPFVGHASVCRIEESTETLPHPPLETTCGKPHPVEIEFGIELIPVLNLSQRRRIVWHLFKMKELRAQLHECWRMEFIRLQCSPWGAPVIFVKKKDGACACVLITTEEVDRDFEGEFLVTASRIPGICICRRASYYGSIKGCSYHQRSEPTMVTEVRSFLGLAGYYRRFVEGFSRLALPLTQLMRKVPVVFQIYSDASKKGLACVLMQHGKVISYASRQLKPYEFLVANGELRSDVKPSATDKEAQRTDEERLCVPNDQALREKVMTEAHSSPFTIHPGSTKMYRDLKQYFWWNGMKQDVATFVSKCMTCQQVKIEHQRASGLLQPLEIPMWKWDEITQDSLLKAWGTRLKFSTAFHPQTDGQSERTIQTLEDMLRACALEWTGQAQSLISLVRLRYWNVMERLRSSGSSSAFIARSRCLHVIFLRDTIYHPYGFASYPHLIRFSLIYVVVRRTRIHSGSARESHENKVIPFVEDSLKNHQTVRLPRDRRVYAS